MEYNKLKELGYEVGPNTEEFLGLYKMTQTTVYRLLFNKKLKNYRHDSFTNGYGTEPEEIGPAFITLDLHNAIVEVVKLLEWNKEESNV